MDQFAMSLGYTVMVLCGLLAVAFLTFLLCDAIGRGIWNKLTLLHDVDEIRDQMRKAADEGRLRNSRLKGGDQ